MWGVGDNMAEAAEPGEREVKVQGQRERQGDKGDCRFYHHLAMITLLLTPALGICSLVALLRVTRTLSTHVAISTYG